MAAFLRCFSICLLSLLMLPSGIAGDLDVLRREFSQLKGEDKIISGLQVCDSLTNDHAELLRFALLLCHDAEKIVPGSRLLARVYRHVADGYYYADSIPLSNEFLLKAIYQAESEVLADSLFIGVAYSDLGLNLHDLGKRTDARHFLQKALEFLDAEHHAESLADAKSNLASLSYVEGKYEEAITLFKEAYQIDLETRNTGQQSTSLNNLGRIYVDWGKYATGLDYYFRSVALLDSIADRRIMAVRYNNIGMAFQLMKRHPDAIRWIEKARLIDEEEGMVLRLGTRYLNLANSYSALRNFQKARIFYEKADSFYSASGQIPALAKVHASFGQMYLEQGNHSQAISHFRKSLEYAESGGSLPEQSLIYNQLYRFYKETSDYVQSLRYHELYTAIRDSVFNLEVSGQVEEMEVQYQTAQKEAEIVRLEAENELRLKEASFRQRERNWALAGAGLLLLFLGGLYWLFSTVKSQKAILSRQNLELERLNSLQNRLFGIISHDLRNATAAYQSSAKMISHYLAKGEPEKLSPLAPEISKNAKVLTEMLENMLQWSVWQMKGIEPEKELVQVKKELVRIYELLKEYASVKNNAIDIQTNGETVWCDPESFSLILRNLVSNALKFTSSGKVTIRSFSEDGHTLIEVTDTGCGMDESTTESLFNSGFKALRRGTSGEKGAGLGMMLVAEHLDRNNGSIRVKSHTGEGTTITVKLPSNNT